MPKKELEATVRAFKACGCNQQRASVSLGIARSTLQHRLLQAAAEGIEVPKLGRQELKDLDQEMVFGRERQRLTEQIKALNSRLYRANQELIAVEDFRKSVFGLVNQPITTPKWGLLKSRVDEDVETPILFASDWQIGERIRQAAIGFNEFNVEVARERIKAMVSKTVELSFRHRGKKKYPGIRYQRGGDMISGEIHEDLRETNDLQSCESARELIRLETWLIEQLHEAFGPVHVDSVPGNHGRTTDKPRSKWRKEENFDILTHYWLESKFEGNKHITFNASSSGDSIFDVYGYKFCMTHGDRIGSRGGEGYLGAVATITRGMRKTFDYYAALGQVIDYMLVGHFHVAMSLEYGYSNGSLPGYSEYAQGFRMRAQAPQQWLLYVHPNMGVVDEKKIQLGPRPKISEVKEAA